MGFPLLDVLGIGMKIIDRVLPNPEQKAAAQLELLKLQQSGNLAELDAELKLVLAQTDINKIEAASPDAYVSSWRPTVGYICCIGLLYCFIVQPIGAWIAAAHGFAEPPVLPGNELYTLLFAMLGLGGMRSFDKVKGTTIGR